MFTHLADFKPVHVICNFSEDCLQCNNKVSGTKFSLKIAHTILKPVFKHNSLDHISRKTWKLHYLGDSNRFLFSSTNIGLTICSAEKTKLLLII